MLMTLLHILFIFFIIVAGLIKGDNRNLVAPADAAHNPSGFFPHGLRGVLSGAAIVYFSYIGYDAVSTLSEEVAPPVQRNIPLGVAASVVLVTALYCVLAASLARLVPYDLIDVESPFPGAFRHAGWEWASKVVGLGISTGIFSSLLVAMLGQARYLCVMGRSHIIPRWFAKVAPFSGTPVNATLCLGIVTSLIALFTELKVLIDLISIGTLLVFYMVANALIFRRYVVRGVTRPYKTLLYLLLFTAASLGFAVCWHRGSGTATSARHVASSSSSSSSSRSSWWWCGLLFFGLWASLLTLIFERSVPQVVPPAIATEWRAPFMPFLAAASIFLNVFLLSSLDWRAYNRIAAWSAFLLLFYALYGVHSTHDTAQHNKQQQQQQVQQVQQVQPLHIQQLQQQQHNADDADDDDDVELGYKQLQQLSHQQEQQLQQQLSHQQQQLSHQQQQQQLSLQQ